MCNNTIEKFTAYLDSDAPADEKLQKKPLIQKILDDANMLKDKAQEKLAKIEAAPKPTLFSTHGNKGGPTSPPPTSTIPRSPR